eukprot:365663-Chlamydomonas_euryale.AAC.1
MYLRACPCQRDEKNVKVRFSKGDRPQAACRHDKCEGDLREREGTTTQATSRKDDADIAKA